MKEFSTPMMKQYQALKSAYADCLLFFRLGDFYELFLEDAQIGARVLDITLTSRPKGKDGRIPMAGVPYHAVDSYLAKLVKAGYKVAICEQLSPPNTKGIIKREIVRVVTPGTLLDEKALEKKENNYLVGVSLKKDSVGLAAVDLSTGEFLVNEFPLTHWQSRLADDLARLSPSECILSHALYNDPHLLKILTQHKGLNIFPFSEWERFARQATSSLKKHFGVHTLAGFGVEEKTAALEAAAAVLGYLQVTQKDTLSHLNRISLLTADEYMSLDHPTMLNLELFTTIRGQDKNGSLLTTLDSTKTGMGGRMLRSWLQRPLRKVSLIVTRQEAVAELLKKRALRNNLLTDLTHIADIERLLSRLSVGIGNARDLVSLKLSLETVSAVALKLTALESPLLRDIKKTMERDIQDLTELLETQIANDPPVDLRSGGIIKEGYHKQLDLWRKEVQGNNEWMEQFERKQRQRTGISSLKVRFNQVFGFSIEVSRANLHLIPKDYIRQQTLIGGERFMTPELKQHEELILVAQEKMNKLEYELFQETLKELLEYTRTLQQVAAAVGCLDCLLNFANLAEQNDYCQPTLTRSGEIVIKNGRHPVVEKLLEERQFVPNDLCLDNKTHQLLVITGPNMAGKSVFIRQTAIICLMAQIGSFVPAQRASISVVDRIFVRSGASDAITSGLSTFMVEMVETAQILQQATKDSLIVMDEIGRGTSTYDGISLAWAVAEYIVEQIGAKTLFATHYHELQSLEGEFPHKIKNFQMAVDRSQSEPVFLHTIVPGSASHSYGVVVAKLAGIPDGVIVRATSILKERESQNINTTKDDKKKQKSNSLAEELHDSLLNQPIESLTPLEALNTLAQWKEKYGKN